MGERARDGHTAAEDAFLAALGARMRELRARRGMTRRVLSARSGVSERYLAQFEAGEGNVSALVLARVCGALGVPVAEMFADERPELALLGKMLARLDEATLAEARRKLGEWFDAARHPGRDARVALTGLRGAGKSSLGRRLAEHRGVAFVELDREVERLAGMGLPDVFEVHGQEGFRRLERDALGAVLTEGVPVVIAAGGGIVAEAATYELLLARCRTVWVRAAPEEHMSRVVGQGDSRPMRDNAEAMEDLRAILAAREPLYARADLTLDTRGRGLEESFAALVGLLEGR